MSAPATQYRRIAEVLRRRIIAGEWRPRRRIPSQQALAAELGVSANTVSRAVACLRNDGYVWTLPHKGSYARPSEDWTA
jgi:DNA-binding GntR family transcriptional regulator